ASAWSGRCGWWRSGWDRDPGRRLLPLGGGRLHDVLSLGVRPPLRPHDVQQRADAVGIELAPGAALDLGDGLVVSQRLAVDAVLRHRVEGVADADHPRPQGNALGDEPVRVAVPVEALVARPY